MISFFAGRCGSGEIRGRQMARHLGARLNPSAGYRDGLCIYVKLKPPETYPKHSYLDILDGSGRMHWLRGHSDIGVIAASLSAKTYLERELGRDVALIPQHHCNFERAAHTKQWPLRLGVVGGKAAIPQDFADALGVTRSCPSTRRGVVDAYLQMDVQIVWRNIKGLRHRPLKNALKIVNAAAFGIPTIALPEPGFEDMEGYYIPAKTKEQVELALEELRDGWDEQRLIKKAEEYHIENVSKRYIDL